MVETVNRRLNKLPEFGLVIIDECHIGNFKKKCHFWYRKKRESVSVTTTPIAEQPLSNHYEELILGPAVTNLIQNGYLVNCDVYGFAVI